MEELPKAGEERILEMVDRDIVSHLSVEILEAKDKLGYSFVGPLFDRVKLAK